jgi:hypothetical protein
MPATPLVVKAARALIRQRGVVNYVRQSLSRSPVDRQVFADPAVPSTIMAGFQLLVGQGTNCEQA